MTSRGQGHRGRPRGASQAPPVFDQQAFADAVGIAIAARFTELARFADDYVATDMAKVRRFENGLKLSIRGRIVGLRLQDMDSMVGTALTIEREIEDAQSTRDTGVSSKRKESQSSSSSRKKQKASSSRGFQSRGHLGQGQIKVASQAG